MRSFTHRTMTRRDAIRLSVAGGATLTVAAAGRGRFSIDGVRAQDAAPSASPAAAVFYAATFYQLFEGATPVKYDKVADPPYNIALSNSYIGNVWRNQMINMANIFVTRPDIQPLISNFQVASSGEDPAAQISQMENMITSGAQAIIVNAITEEGLVPTVRRAREEGIVVVAFDNVIKYEDIVFVNEDQTEMGRRWAQWLVDQIGDTGKVLMVNGVAGTSVDSDRQAGAKEVFGQHTGIQLIEIVGKWDPGTAQSETKNVLATNKDITGVWCQGGTDGVVRAFQEAGLTVPPVAGEAENGFRKQMLSGAVNGYSIGQSPGLVAVSIRVALDLLQGNEVPSAISVPLPEAKNADLQPGVNVFPDAPDNFFTPVNIEACGVSFSYEEIAPQS